MKLYRVMLVDYVEAADEAEAMSKALDEHEGLGVVSAEPSDVDPRASIDKARQTAAHALERWKSGEKPGHTPASVFDVLESMRRYFLAANRRGES
jgi:hypothetical protein